MLSWLMDKRPNGVESSVWNLTRRILATNVASIYTTSMAFTHALYHLAAMPQYIQPMREEVEKVVGKEGWTKAAIDKLNMVDSFLKETMVGFMFFLIQQSNTVQQQRFTGISCGKDINPVLRGHAKTL